MIKFNILTIFTILFVLFSCTNSVDFNSEKDYFEEKGEGSILYYKGAPFTGELVKKYNLQRIRSIENYDEGKLQGENYYYDSFGNLLNFSVYDAHLLKKKEVNYYNKKNEHVMKCSYPYFWIDSTEFRQELLYENGKPCYITKFRDNEYGKVPYGYYSLLDNGDTINKTEYNEFGKPIYSIDYFFNGKVKRILDYQKRKVQDYHPNGRINRELKLDENNKIVSGKYNYWDVAGSQFELEYDNGVIKTGELMEYYDNGNKKNKSLFENNELVSIELFRPDGSLITTDKTSNIDDTLYYASGRIQRLVSKDIKSEGLCTRYYFDMPYSPLEKMVCFDEKNKKMTDNVKYGIFGDIRISKSQFFDSKGRKIRKPKLKEYVYHASLKGETNLDPGWSWETGDTIYIGTKRNLLFVAHAYASPIVKYMDAEELEYSTPPNIIDYIKNVLTNQEEQLSDNDKKEIEQRVKKEFLKNSIPEEADAEAGSIDEWRNLSGETTKIFSSTATVEATKTCLVGYDWIYPSSSSPTSAWKFSSDGTFNYSTYMFGGMSAWGTWSVSLPGKVRISYTRTTEGTIPGGKILTMTSCNGLKVGSTNYYKD